MNCSISRSAELVASSSAKDDSLSSAGGDLKELSAFSVLGLRVMLCFGVSGGEGRPLTMVVVFASEICRDGGVWSSMMEEVVSFILYALLSVSSPEQFPSKVLCWCAQHIYVTRLSLVDVSQCSL